MNYLREVKQVDGSYSCRSHIEGGLKLGLLKVETKIYQTIKGLIILFI